MLTQLQQPDHCVWLQAGCAVCLAAASKLLCIALLGIEVAAVAAAAAVGLTMCKTVVEDTWNKVFIGGLPCHYTDDQVRALEAHGQHKHAAVIRISATKELAAIFGPNRPCVDLSEHEQ